MFGIAYAGNKLTTRFRTFMHGFSKSFNVDNVFIYIVKDDLNHLCGGDVQERLISALRMLPKKESWPKYYFKGYVSNEESLIARTCKKNIEWENQLEKFNIDGNLDIRRDVDKDFYFVFDIDLSYFNFKPLLKDNII